jgi:hypothetical protein
LAAPKKEAVGQWSEAEEDKYLRCMATWADHYEQRKEKERWWRLQERVANRPIGVRSQPHSVTCYGDSMWQHCDPW